jgi:predicted small lipoprotein YifL
MTRTLIKPAPKGLMKPIAISLGLALALSVTACGRQGDLETAPPLWGERAKAEIAAKKKAEAEGKATERALPRAEYKNEMPDPYQQNKRVSDAPLEGTGNAQRHDSGTH